MKKRWKKVSGLRQQTLSVYNAVQWWFSDKNNNSTDYQYAQSVIQQSTCILNRTWNSLSPCSPTRWVTTCPLVLLSSSWTTSLRRTKGPSPSRSRTEAAKDRAHLFWLEMVWLSLNLINQTQHLSSQPASTSPMHCWASGGFQTGQN